MTTRIGLKHDRIRISCIILDLYRLNTGYGTRIRTQQKQKDYGYRIKWGIEVLERLSRATILFIVLRGRGVTKKKKRVEKGTEKKLRPFDE